MLNSNGKLIRRPRPKWPDKWDRTNAPWRWREGAPPRPVMKLCIRCGIRRVAQNHHILCLNCYAKEHGTS